MSVTTNSLVTKATKVGATAVAAAAILLGGAFVIGHTAHAASNGAALSGGAPMDDNSVSSLVALDNAVEAVAARVTPAVVNVAVTSKVTGQEADSDDDGQDSGETDQSEEAAEPTQTAPMSGRSASNDNIVNK